MTQSKRMYDALAGLIKATANPHRLYLLDILQDQHLCVRELAELLELDISTVSRHLTQLKNHGLVEDHREGQCIYYRITCDCVRRYLKAAMSILESTIERNRQILEPPKGA